MADDVQNLLLRFRGEAGNVKSEIDDVIGHLKALDSTNAETDVSVKGVAKSIADLEVLRATIAALPDDKTIRVSAKTDLPSNALLEFTKNIGGAQDKASRGGLFGNLGNGLTGLAAKIRGVGDEADRSTGITGRFASSLEKLGASLSTSGSKASSSGNQLGRFGTEIIQVFSGTTDASLASVSALAGLAVVIGILVAALAALAASAAAAVGGLLAIGTAIAGLLLPAGILAFGVFRSLTQVMTALQAKQQASQQAAIKDAQGHATAAAAAYQRKQAEQSLGDALANLSDARLQALREEQDAAEKVKDSILALQEARLGKQEAALGFRQAKYDLQQFRLELGLSSKDVADFYKKFTDVKVDPKGLRNAIANLRGSGGTTVDQGDQLKLEALILRVRRARLDQKGATDGVHDATVNLNRAQQDNNKFLRQGLVASKSYVGALHAVRDAREALTRANNRTGVDTGMAKAQFLTHRLSKEQQGLLRIIQQVQAAFKTAFGPAINAVIGGIASSLSGLPAAMKGLSGDFTAFGKAVGGGIKEFFKFLTSKESLAAFSSFTQVAGILAGPIAKSMGKLFIIFTRIGTAALPALLAVLQPVFDFIDRIFKSTGNADKLNGIISFLVSNFQTWAGVFSAFGNLFLAFLMAAAPAGQALATWIGRAANHLADFLKSKKGRQQVQQFFDDTLPVVESLVRFLARTIVVLLQIGQDGAPALRLLFDVLTVFLGIISHVLTAFHGLERFIQAIPSHIKDVPGKIIGFFSHLLDWAFNLGRDIIHRIKDGFKQGVKEAKGGILNIIKGVPTTLLHGITGPLGIKSPSKVMIEVGHNVMEGLTIGLDSHANKLAKTITNSMVNPFISPRMVPAGGGGGGTRIGTSIGSQTLILPTPAGGGNADPRHTATQFYEEMRRRASQF